MFKIESAYNREDTGKDVFVSNGFQIAAFCCQISDKINVNL
mgnify:CR=1 FL=1